MIVYAADASEVRSTVPGFAGLAAGGVDLPAAFEPRIAVASGVAGDCFSGRCGCVGVCPSPDAVFGRRVVAVGDNVTARGTRGVPLEARVGHGVRVHGADVRAFGRYSTRAAWTSISSSNTGLFYELNAIAAVIIGGTSMSGSAKIPVLGTVVGVLLLGVIENMLTMLGVNPYLQDAVKGCIIIGAVLIQRGRR